VALAMTATRGWVRCFTRLPCMLRERVLGGGHPDKSGFR
jgi:hypothetical protein